MSNITPFAYEGRDVRTVEIDGDPWFVAADVCAVLDIGNPTQALTRLDDDESTLISNEGRQTNVISESGLYSLILGSRKPEAKAFRRWITHEVIPSIRKTGSYSVRSEHQVNAVIFQARAQMELCQAAKGLIHPDHLEARARVVLARGLGEKPELDSGRRPLYTQDYLKEKSLSTSRLKSVAGVFGKRVKAAFVLAHGRDPERYPLNLPNGQVREVNGYTEADRPLMDKVWSEHYAEVTA